MSEDGPYKSKKLNALVREGKGRIGKIKSRATEFGPESLNEEDYEIWTIFNEEMRGPELVKGAKGGLVRKFKGGGKVRIF